MKRLAQKRNRKGERGSILAMSAIGMLSLLLAVGLSVDITHLYLAKNELQNAADASALAGASGLNFEAGGIAIATNRAVQAMNSYEFNNQQVVFTAANVRFAANLSDFDSGPGMDQTAAAGVASTIRFVKVITPTSPVPMSFVGFLLGSSRNLTAQAVGGVSANLNVYTGYLPLFPVDDDTIIRRVTFIQFAARPETQFLRETIRYWRLMDRVLLTIALIWQALSKILSDQVVMLIQSLAYRPVQSGKASTRVSMTTHRE